MGKNRRRRNYITIETEVDIEIDDYVGDISDEALLEEIETRGLVNEGDLLDVSKLSINQTCDLMDFYKKLTEN